MTMEYLDIINEQDEVVSKASRDEAHEKNLLHRAVLILLTNNKNQILLQLRKSLKEQFPLYWTGSVDGHVSAGESADQAAHREMKEELNLETDLEFIDKFVIQNETENQMINVFYGQCDQTINLDRQEGEKMEWLDIADLKESMDIMRLTPHCQKALTVLFTKNKSIYETGNHSKNI